MVSTLLVYLAGHIKQKGFAKFLIIISVFVPCYLAAVRDSTIGTDMQEYGEHLFQICKGTSYFEIIDNAYQEPLFILVASICSNFFNRYVYYFVLQVLVIAPIMSTVLYYGKKKAWMGMLVYYLWFYGYTLNLMRQSIAIALIIYGVRYIFENKKNKYFLCIVIACGFHLSAILGLLIYAIYFVIIYEAPAQIETVEDTARYKKRFSKAFNNFKYRYNVVFRICCLGVMVISVFLGSMIIQGVSLITGRFGYQVTHLQSSYTFNTRYFVALVVIIFMINYRAKKNNIITSELYQLFIMLVSCGMILFQLMGISFQMYRVSLYFTCFFVVLIPMVFCGKKRMINTLTFWCIAGIMLYLFYGSVVLHGWNGIYPYTSVYLGIR